MRFGLGAAILALIVPGGWFTAFGQSSAPAHKPPASSQRYCHPNAGFCFRYPNSWTMLGDIFDGNGVVVAPAQKGDRELWDEITVALVASASGEGPSLNSIVDRTTTAMREAGQNFQTLQRQERSVDHNPAQMLKAQYRENATGRDWIEELIFIQGPEDRIYSVALKCAPEHLPRLEPAMKEVLASWTFQQPPEEAAPDDTTTQPAAPKASGGQSGQKP